MINTHSSFLSQFLFMVIIEPSRVISMTWYYHNKWMVHWIFVSFLEKKQSIRLFLFLFFLSSLRFGVSFPWIFNFVFISKWNVILYSDSFMIFHSFFLFSVYISAACRVSQVKWMIVVNELTHLRLLNFLIQFFLIIWHFLVQYWFGNEM